MAIRFPREPRTAFPLISPHADLTFSLDREGELCGGRIYGPYREALAGDLSSSPGFQEDYQDPSSSLIWMGARRYSPQLARFLSPDPLSGKAEEPLSLNPYLYCSGDPVNFLDPEGLDPVSALLRAIGQTQNALTAVNRTVDVLRKTGEDVPGWLLSQQRFLARALNSLVYTLHSLLSSAAKSSVKGNRSPTPAQYSQAMITAAKTGFVTPEHMQEIIQGWDLLEHMREAYLQLFYEWYQPGAGGILATFKRVGSWAWNNVLKPAGKSMAGFTVGLFKGAGNFLHGFFYNLGGWSWGISAPASSSPT